MRLHPLALAALSTAAGLLAATTASAQVLDDLELRRDGADAVLALRFVAPVQFSRLLATQSGDLVQVFYELQPTRDLPPQLAGERRLPATGALPALVVSDDSVGRGVFSRRLVLRADKPLLVRVRPGRTRNSLELVLTGQGSAMLATPAPASASVPALAPAPALTTAPVLTGPLVSPVTLVVAAGAAATSAEAPAATTPPAPVPTPRPSISPPASAPTAPTAPTAASTTDPAALDSRAAQLLAAARQADAQQDHAFALARLGELLDLPPNASSRAAQALIADLRLRTGDAARARAEYQTFLKLYPEGADADAARAALAQLGTAERRAAGPRPRAPVAPSTTLVGSASVFHYGGSSKVRTQEFQDSPISGLPELASDNTLAGTDQKQLMNNVDVNWRHRDADTDMRFVLRDTYTADLLRRDKSRNRLSALYFEHRSLTRGTGIKLGRQSPTGGGVLGRFDGVQGSYSFAPKWKVNAVLGAPTDKLLDARRQFYGTWVEAEALTPELSGSLYFNQGRIDGQVDRRALGTELRWFSGGLSVSGVLDHDLVIGGLNIASLQATWQSPGNTVVNVMLDRRATPMLMLGNALFFGATVPAPNDLDPNATRLAVSIKDLLANGYAVGDLRQNVKDTSTATTQALFSVNTPVSANWQLGFDLRSTQLGELPAIPVILPNGQGRSDNKGFGLQAIATNLYSARDTHVLSLSRLTGSGVMPDPVNGAVAFGYSGTLLSYNNASQLNEQWLLEPSLKVYTQSDLTGIKTTRTSPGLRVTWRPVKPLSLESELSGEVAKTSGPARNETSNRVFYYLGGRYDF